MIRHSHHVLVSSCIEDSNIVRSHNNETRIRHRMAEPRLVRIVRYYKQIGFDPEPAKESGGECRVGMLAHVYCSQ